MTSLPHYPANVNCVTGQILIGYDPAADWVAYRLDGRLIILPADLAADLDGLLSYRRIDAQEIISAEAVADVMRRAALYGMTFDVADAFVLALQRIDRLGDVVGTAEWLEAA